MADAAFTQPAPTGWLRQRHYLVLPLLGLTLAGALLVGVGHGAVALSPAEVLAILLRKAGIVLPVDYTSQQEAVLWAIRLPRVVMGALVGAGLAVSGAALQGIFRNPLADPGLIGVSSGAAFGVALVIVTGLSAAGLFTLPLAAFAGGLLTSIGIYRFSRRSGRTEVTTLILAGIALNALLGALVSFLIYLANDPQLRSIVFWMMGSLGGSLWRFVALVAPATVVAVLLLIRLATPLNLLVLGEAEARHLGVDTERVRIIAIALAALATGTVVAFNGIIGFVGLIVPHLLRLLVGPDHRVLLPANAIGGAAVVVGADLLARTVVSPTELPLGIVMAFAGAPMFLYLIERTRRHHGGWG